jgi:hypothetical protein
VSDAVLLMTVLDLFILGMCGAAALLIRPQGRLMGQRAGSGGRLVVLTGLSLISLVSVADLLTIYALPFWSPETEATAIMADLRGDARWWLSLTAVGLITIGLVLSERRLLGLIADLETRKSILNGEQAAQEKRAGELRVRDVLARAPRQETPRPLRDVERDHILRTLDRTDWVIEGDRGAARLLEMAPSTLRSRMQKLGIRRHRAHHG